MENITTGHWIFALIALSSYLLFILWSYWKEKTFNYQMIPMIIYMGLILLLLVLIS